MTIPWLMNCGHNDDGWCLDCVKEQHAELERYRLVVEMIIKRNKMMNPTICLDMLEKEAERALGDA